MKPYALSIKHKALPGKRDEVWKVWEKHMAPAIAANPGHTDYFYCFDNADPDSIHAFQQYRSQEASQEFLKTESYAAYLKESEPLLAGPPHVTVLIPKWSKGRPREESRPNEQDAATAALRRLEPFLGCWNTEGEMIAGPSASSVGFNATDTYEWQAGGRFLLHRFDADMPDGKVRGIEVIGYDPERESYTMRSFDSSGSVSVMQAKADGDAWTFIGETLRFSGGFRDNGTTFAGLWEIRAEDGSAWRPLMNVRLRKSG